MNSIDEKKMGNVLIKRATSREIKFTPNINPYAYGSVIVEFGQTKVHVTATVEENVPPFLKGKGQGWTTAEYSMLPSATHTRNHRERQKVSGRTYEIQRLIGRSLRSAIDLSKLGERSIHIDCDVLVADGGTRTASISGGFVALKLAINRLLKEGKLKNSPLICSVAAVSLGVNSKGEILCDLNYEEDSSCETDLNLVMNNSGNIIEVQATAEKKAFTHNQLMGMLEVGQEAIQTIFEKQNQCFDHGIK